MNKCVIVGNLTKDPDLRTIPSSGTSVCNFTVAVSRRFANQAGEREADFIPVVVWRIQAENCAKYLRKGSSVAVSGSIQTRTYDGQDGTKRYVTEVMADEVQFLNRAADGNKTESSNSISEGSGFQNNEEPSGMHEIDEDLPF